MLKNLTFRKTEPSDLEIEIARVLKMMSGMPPGGEEYAKVNEEYVKLRKLQLEIDSKRKISPDTLTTAATNLLGIVVVLNYEHVHVITSKAFSMVWKAVK